MGEKQPGSNVELSIRRNGERRTLQARLVSSQEVRQNNRQYAANDDGYNRGNRQNGWNQNGWNRNRASSYDPNAQSGSQSVNQQIRMLRQQVAQLQQEVDELRNQSANGARVGYRNRSNDTSRMAVRPTETIAAIAIPTRNRTSQCWQGSLTKSHLTSERGESLRK